MADTTPPNRWQYLALGSELAGCVIVPVLLGWWADTSLDWAPVGVIVGAFLGLAAAGLTLFRLVKQQDL